MAREADTATHRYENAGTDTVSNAIASQLGNPQLFSCVLSHNTPPSGLETPSGTTAKNVFHFALRTPPAHICAMYVSISRITQIVDNVKGI